MAEDGLLPYESAADRMVSICGVRREDVLEEFRHEAAEGAKSQLIRVTVTVKGRLSETANISPEGQSMEMLDGSRVRDLLVILGLLDEEVKRVSVNGRRARLDASLHPRDVIEFA